MIDQLINFVLWILGPLVLVAAFTFFAFIIKRAIRAYLENKYAGAAGPVWFLSAALLSLVCFVVAIRALWTESRWIDPAVWTWLKRVVIEGVDAAHPFSFPESALWIACAILFVTLVYSLLALLIAWLLGPPPTQSPSTSGNSSRRRGMPPPSSAASAQEPRMGVLLALDTAAASGTVQWLYTHLGYWDDPRPGAEPRYRGWVEPLHNTLAWIKWPSLIVASFGVASALAWVTAALLHDALKQLLSMPPIPPEEEEAEEEEEEEEPTPEQPEAEESEVVSSLAHELGGEGFCMRPVGISSSRTEARDEERWPPTSAGPLWMSVLDQWTSSPLQLTGDVVQGFWPYPAQKEAARFVLEETDTLLPCPRGSGKNSIADLLGAQTALCRSGSVLVIVPSREDSAKRVSTLRKLGRSGGWHWVVNTHDLSTDGISGLDPLVEQPEVVVGTVDDFERHLMAVSSHWDIFLATLSLVVVLDIDEHSGARATSLGSLCRRLLLLAGDFGATPTALVTASGLWQETTALAEEVTSRSLEVVETAQRGGPRSTQAVYIVGCDDDASRRLHQRILDSGWNCMAFDGDDPAPRLHLVEDQRDEEDAPIKRRRLAIVAPLESSHLPIALDELSQVPSGASSDDRVLVFRAQTPDHPTSTSVLAPPFMKSPMPSWLVGRKPVLPNGWGNPAAAARALQRALTERESSLEELEDHHGNEAVRHELEVLDERGLLEKRRSALPHPSTGLPEPLLLYRLTDPTRVRTDDLADVVTSAPLTLRESSTSQELLSVDKVRAAVSLYPGCVFSLGGRRFRVSDAGDQPTAEPEPEEVWTLPVRRIDIEPGGWTPQRARLGGSVQLECGRGPVSTTITVTGIRRFDAGGHLLDERSYEAPLEATYASRAVLLRFPANSEGLDPFSEAAVHAMVHLIRAVVPASIRASWLDIDITPLEADDTGVSGLAIIDLHPFGAGYADVFRTGVLRRLIKDALSLVGESPTAAGPALCPSPAARWPAPDRAAAAEALGLLVRPPGN